MRTVRISDENGYAVAYVDGEREEVTEPGDAINLRTTDLREGMEIAIGGDVGRVVVDARDGFFAQL